MIAADPPVIPSVASTHGSSEDMIDALAPRDSPKMENKSIVTMDLISMISGCCVKIRRVRIQDIDSNALIVFYVVLVYV